MTGMFKVVLVIGIVYHSLDVALVIAYRKFQSRGHILARVITNYVNRATIYKISQNTVMALISSKKNFDSSGLIVISWSLYGFPVGSAAKILKGLPLIEVSTG
ncbi:MAG: hypothetical protein MZV63_29565 [Marinilabiliales bacterium]|nr:hypothetical protein [Marinilabiliales bacterium]